jgi:hypothetical protein
VAEEEKRRKEIRADFDKAVKELKEKVSKDMNEEELKKKNVELKAEMQKMMDENKKKSEEIELKIKEKQKNSEVVQERLKTMMQTKLETLLTDSTKEKQRQIELMQKEQELKAQITMYDSNFDQLDDSIKKSGKVFSQLKKEIKKVRILLKKNVENRDVKECRRSKERFNESKRRI